MYRAGLAAVILVSVSAAASAQLQPLNVMPGLWEMTMTSAVNATIPPEMQARMSQLPPEQRARLEELLRNRLGGQPQTTTHRSCVTAADLAKMPFQDSKMNCTWNTLTSNGSAMEIHGTACRIDNGNGQTATGEVNVSIRAANSQNASGTIQFAMSGPNGQSVSANNSFTGRWISATCPPDN